MSSPAVEERNLRIILLLFVLTGSSELRRCFGAKKEAKKHLSIHSFVPAVESGKAERSGAEKEAKKHLSIHSLAQRTNQETSTLTKAFDRWSTSVVTRQSSCEHGSALATPSVILYGEDATQKIAETVDFDYVFFLHDSG